MATIVSPSPRRRDLPADHVSPARVLEQQQNEYVIASPFVFLSTYNVAIFYMLWYCSLQFWTLANHVVFVRHQDALFGRNPHPTLYMVFMILGLILWGFVGVPIAFYAARYARTAKLRVFSLSVALALFYVFSDVPMFFLDLTIVYRYGWRHVVQGLVLVLRTASFLVQSLVVWHIYMYRMAGWLHTTVWPTNDLLEMQARRAADKRVRTKYPA